MKEYLTYFTIHHIFRYNPPPLPHPPPPRHRPPKPHDFGHGFWMMGFLPLLLAAGALFTLHFGHHSIPNISVNVNTNTSSNSNIGSNFTIYLVNSTNNGRAVALGGGVTGLLGLSSILGTFSLFCPVHLPGQNIFCPGQNQICLRQNNFVNDKIFFVHDKNFVHSLKIIFALRKLV